MDESFFFHLAAPILDRDANPEGHGAREHFRRFFGASPLVVVLAFELLNHHELLPPGSLPIHLLWACGFVRQYSRESVLTSLYGATMMTIRYHMWPIIAALGALTHIVVRTFVVVSSFRFVVVGGGGPLLIPFSLFSSSTCDDTNNSFSISFYTG